MFTLLLLVACRGTADGPWNETTVPYDPLCSDCVSLETTTLDHMGDVEILVSEADDALAQWAICLESIMDCADAGGTPEAAQQALDGCVASSTCPDVCKDAFSDAGGGGGAFESVFVAPEGACGLPDGQVTP